MIADLIGDTMIKGNGNGELRMGNSCEHNGLMSRDCSQGQSISRNSGQRVFAERSAGDCLGHRSAGRMRALLALFARYGAIGIVATMLYLAAASGLRLASMGAGAASTLAYIAACSISYLGHRTVTFRSTTRHRRAVPRFLAVSFLGLGVAAVLPPLVEQLTPFDAHVGFLAVAVVVAVCSFISLRLAVFPAVDDAVREVRQ